MVTTAPAELPDSVEELRALVLLQQEQNADQVRAYESTVSAYSEEIAQLREFIRLLKSQRFGPSRERMDASQLGLFNEAEALVDAAADADESATVEVPAHTRRRRGGRKPLPDFLPREEIVHDLPEHEKVCLNDPSHRLSRIGEERHEQLAFQPARIKVIVNIRPKYACSSCKDGVKVAPPPPQVIPKSLATPSLLAQIITGQYVDGLPLYRQEQIFGRIGVELGRTTMASWVIRAAELVLPVVNLFLEGIRKGHHVLADETTFQVLKEKGRKATSKSYLWALRGGPAEHPLLFYEYAPTRSGAVAEALLEGFEGFLQTDGYKGYDRFDKRPGVVHVGCFAHARRKFVEALRGQGKKSKGPRSSLAKQGLSRIKKLYELERGYKDASPEERFVLRQQELAPKLDELRDWLDGAKDRVPPGSLTGEAMVYLDHQWPKLVRVLEDGRLPLDTNAVERAIRPFVIGRRNWHFADTPKGAAASARLYSLVETAKANGVEPWAYLEVLFERLPRAQSPADYAALLPWRVELEPPEGRIAQT